MSDDEAPQTKQRLTQAPAGLSAARFQVGTETLAVLSFPIQGEARRTEELTPAEHEVVGMMLQGLSNAAIGERRRTSPRTVANQIASIFRKLGVGSRGELAAAIAGHLSASE